MFRRAFFQQNLVGSVLYRVDFRNSISFSLMPASSFDAIFFDLFNTLIHFDYSRLPEVEYQGGRIQTTYLEVYRRLEQKFELSFSLHDLLRENLFSKQIVEQQRGPEDREISSLERHRLIQQRLAVAAPEAAALMVEAHMGQMFDMMYFPEENHRVLEALEEIPLVLASNFDHAATARRALRKFGLEDRFAHIFISEEVGWRKPGRRFFESILAESGFQADRCLFVGDDLQADVGGAMRAGFQVAWLCGSKEQFCDIEGTPPHWTVNQLSDIVSLVGTGGVRA